MTTQIATTTVTSDQCNDLGACTVCGAWVGNYHLGLAHELADRAVHVHTECEGPHIGTALGMQHARWLDAHCGECGESI
jgi:hypothetical protein